MKSKILLSTGILGLILFAGCSPSNLSSTNDEKKPNPESHVQNNNSGQKNRDDRISAVIDIVHKMSPNGMIEVKKLFPDLKKIAEIPANDTRNFLGKMPEDWLYSKNDDVVIAVCAEMNTPLHISHGKMIPQVEIDDAKKMMMDMMMSDEMGNNEMMKEDQMMMGSGEMKAFYGDYNADDFDAHAGKKALFFHANWCPTCRAMEKDILENISKMPADTYIAKVDYDTATALRKKYGVTAQSTIVFIDKNGDTEVKLAPSTEEISTFFQN